MTDGDAVRLLLEIDTRTESIAGRLCRVDPAVWQFGDDDEDVWHFTGWVELTRALEEAWER